MNVKRFVMAAVALFVYIYIFEFLVHGVLLAHLYTQTSMVWRDYSQMMSYLPYNIFIMALIATWVTFIFTRLFKVGGWKNGLTFGIYFGVLSGIQAAGAYYYLPISITLTVSWFIAYVVESIIGGIIIGAIYRENTSILERALK